MGDSEHINETVETINMLIVSATEQLKENKKRPDDHAILDYLQKKGNSINKQTLSLSIASLCKNVITSNTSCKNDITSKSFLTSFYT